MPLGDGTGPLGFGPRTGYGRGTCLKRSFSYGMGRRKIYGTKNKWLFSILTPVAIAVVRELIHPSGLLRQLVSPLLLKKKKYAVTGKLHDTAHVVFKSDPSKIESATKQKTTVIEEQGGIS